MRKTSEITVNTKFTEIKDFYTLDLSLNYITEFTDLTKITEFTRFKLSQKGKTTLQLS